MKTYSKPHFSIDQQIAQLKNRGMIFLDEDKAKIYFESISYYRLSAYWNPFEVVHTSVIPKTHLFKPDTTFERVIESYVFDRKLRIHVMEAIERIEIAIRTSWAHILSESYGSHGYLNPDYFSDILQHAEDLVKINSEVKRSKESFIKHYNSTYQSPPLPPIWAVTEVMSLGSLSRWFKNTKSIQLRKKVAKQFGFQNAELLESALHALTAIRNTCAHHGRLWNRKFTMTFMIPQNMQSQFIPSTQPDGHKLFNTMVLLDFMTKEISSKTTWGQRLYLYVHELGLNARLAMGFPVDWKDREPWKSFLGKVSHES